ncbi:MAG: hypothetical protein UT50_C0003G0020 [Candidatus Moranbacteria bacterium GW2011_GWA2_39_41]|nr:MAG: hypothetical protein UT50_C0003G0020 [Candidatus Moranbacteria bacterium GW2011_GWA2_39_41]
MQTIDDHLSDFFEKTTIPFIYFPQNNVQSKKQLAIYISMLNDNTVLLSTAWTFSFPAALAGLSYKQVEYIAKHAPTVYKKQLVETIQTSYKIKEALEISKNLDESTDNNAQHQQRVKNVIQYIKDNRNAFEF